MSEDIEGKLLKAKIVLLEDSVFFSTILFGLKQVITDRLPTAAVDGISIFFNPEYVEPLSSDQVVGLFLHEVSHIAYDHIGRRGDRDPKLYNIAADIIIDTDLKNQGFDVPDSLADDQYFGWSTEKVYEKLLESAIQIPSGSRPDLLEPKNKEEAKSNVQELIVQAIVACDMKDVGEQVPGSIRIYIDKLLNPVIPWRNLLQKYMQEYSKDDYSWSRPNRRFLPDLYLPSQYSPSIKHLVVAVDLSGSESLEDTRVHLTEVEGLRNEYKLEKLTLYSVDTKIRSKFEIDETESLLDKDLKGGGGTDFRSFFKELENEPPTVLIFFTDMCVYFDFPKPTFDVIWINTYDSQIAPDGYGRTIIFKRDDK